MDFSYDDIVRIANENNLKIVRGVYLSPKKDQACAISIIAIGILGVEGFDKICEDFFVSSAFIAEKIGMDFNKLDGLQDGYEGWEWSDNENDNEDYLRYKAIGERLAIDYPDQV